ncbi:unnamed protein product [Owenia fusiformis]|uniref:Uncharacterized protein n=1 Tax=Owenia fusiformis TaxID=6347 RepID=A0A8J1TQD4_OWEFU|nr:unnamed protein product [Owenia fusiformis]
MRTYVASVIIVLCCVLETTTATGLGGFFAARKKAGRRGNVGVRYAMGDHQQECTPGSKYKYANSSCNYLVCKENRYELAHCEDGKGVTESFRRIDTSMRYPCSRFDVECRKTLEEKGVVETNVQVCGLDLVFIIDMSKSISDVDKMKVRSFVLQIIRSLKLGSAFTLVAGSTYGAEVHNFLKLSSYNRGTEMVRAASNMEMNPKRGTATWLALQEAREILLSIKGGRRKGKKAVVIVASDGVSHPHSMSKETIEQAELLKKPKSYDPETGAPTVFLLDLPNNKEQLGEDESGKKLPKAELDKLKELKDKEFAAIPSKPEYRYNPESFDDLEKFIIPILRKSCEDL